MVKEAQDWCEFSEIQPPMTMTQDSASEYPLLEGWILVNTFQDNEPKKWKQTKVNKTKNETCKQAKKKKL